MARTQFHPTSTEQHPIKPTPPSLTPPETHPLGAKKENFDPLMKFLHKHLEVSAADAAAAEQLAAQAEAEEAAAASAHSDGAQGPAAAGAGLGGDDKEAAAKGGEEEGDEIPEAQFPVTD